MSNTVNNWISSVRGAEYGFFPAVVDALQSFNDGDYNKLAKLLCITHGRTCKRLKVVEKDRMQYAAHLKRILDYSLQGVDYKFNKEKDFGVVFKKSDNGGVDSDRIQTLKMLGRKTIRDKMYKDAFPPIKKGSDKSTAEKLEARAELDMKWLKDNDVSLDVYIAKLQAMRGRPQADH